MGISRRSLLLATAAGVVSSWPGARPALLAADGPPPLSCSLTAPGPRFRTAANLRPEPFTTPLPRPAALSAAAVTLPLAITDVRVLPGTTTPMLTFAGTFPGPTIRAVPGQATQVTVVNEFDEAAVLHLHGAHVPASEDGHVRDLIPSGGSRTYHYANAQRPATLWYHDHLLMRTAERVYRGLAGMYLLLDPAEAALGLPVGDERDVEVILTDRSFADDGTLVYDSTGHTPFFGDVVLVNGADRPWLEVAAGLVRLRILNGSNARPYTIARADGVDLVHIGTDGGLLGAPTPRAALELWPAERVEVLLDLSDAPEGTQVVLVDRNTRADDPGLLRIDVVDAPGSAAPAVLSLPELEALPPPEVTRTITLDEARGRFLLNGHGYDDAIRDVHARLGAVERWRLVNTTQSSHPMHLHLVHFRVRRRLDVRGQDLPLRPEDDGWKDTVLVRAFETVELDARFADHTGDFLYHCHVLEHEDHDMMSQFRVVDLARIAGRNRVETAAAVAAQMDGPREVVVVAGGADWPAALAGAAVADALLLVQGGQLDDAVDAELRRLPPAEIVVAGDTTHVPETVAEALAAHAPVRRVVGVDAVDTAALLARSVAGSADTAVVATVQNWPDALAAGVLGVPVLLTDPGTLSPATAEALAALGVRTVLIAGGVAAVSQGVETALGEAGYQTERIAGPERTATAAAFARRAGLSTTVHVASALRFPDALAAATLARRDGMLVLTGDGGASEATAAVLAEAGPRRMRIIGGEAAVPLSAEEDLAARI